MIPNYVPQPFSAQWSSVKSQYENPEMGLVMANKWLLSQSVIAAPIKRAKETLVPVKFTVNFSKQLISRTSDGQDYITAVLSDDQPYLVPNADGSVSIEQFTLPVLKKFAETINREMPVGDVDHKFYDEVLKSNLSDEQIKRALAQKPGVVKAVKALVDKGKLYLRLLIDKRYRRVVEKANGLSIEALVSKDAAGRVQDGSFLGFTVAANCSPVNQRAVLLH